MCKNFQPIWRKAKDLFFRKFTSEYHREKWIKFEQILMIRTMMGLASSISMGIASMLLGHESYQILDRLL